METTPKTEDKIRKEKQRKGIKQRKNRVGVWGRVQGEGGGLGGVSANVVVQQVVAREGAERGEERPLC